MSPRLFLGAVLAGLGAGLCGLTLCAAAVILGSPGGGGDAAAAGCAPSAGADVPSELVGIYEAAAATYRLGRDGWAWLAAVNRIETDFGRNLATSSADAVGWMQFEPTTWATFGVDGDGDGRRDPYDPADAIPAAARYLAALGAPADWETAIRAYNGGPGNARAPSTLGYWSRVAASEAAFVAGAAAPAAGCEPCPPAELVAAGVPDAAGGGDGFTAAAGTDYSAGAFRLAARPGDAAASCAGGGTVPPAPGDRAQIAPDGTASAPASAPAGVRAMIAAGNELIGRPYVYGGGHAGWTLAAGYDCSASVSWALHGAGYLAQPQDSITLEGFGDPGAGLWVTVFANPGHAFVEVAGIRLDTSPQPGDGRLAGLGPRWRPATRSTAGFVARHPAGR